MWHCVYSGVICGVVCSVGLICGVVCSVGLICGVCNVRVI